METVHQARFGGMLIAAGSNSERSTAVTARAPQRRVDGAQQAGAALGRRSAWRSWMPFAVLALVVCALAVFVISIPAWHAQLGDACTGNACKSDQVSEAGVNALGRMGISLDTYAAAVTGLTVAAALAWFGSALLIAGRRPDEPFALIAALALVLTGTFTVTGSLESGSALLDTTIRILNNLELVVFILFLALFPDGRFAPAWSRWIVAAAAVLAVTLTVWPDAESLGPLWFGIMATLLGAQVYRYHRVASRTQRQQAKWVLFSCAMVVLVVLGMFVLTEILATDGAVIDVIATPVATVALAGIPLAIGVAILRHQLFDIDLIIRRALVYGVLSAGVVAAYIGIVGSLGALFNTGASLPTSLIATGAVALLFAPVRDRVQRGANRLVYGDRNDPYAVLSRLGRQLQTTIEPSGVLPAVVTSIKDALRLPWVAIVLPGHEQPVAEAGVPVYPPLRLPLTYQNEPVGEMLVGQRPGEDTFDVADLRLLEDVARQAGVAAHAVLLTADLQRARARLVTAREEERRRLRRDLHDGLGAQLSSQALTIDAVRTLMRSDPGAAESLLLDLKAQSRDAVTDLRRLVHDLRPPALDHLGLVDALRESAARAEPETVVIAPDQLPPLTTAVEVALYRIAMEALTNIQRHAGASRCTIEVAVVRSGQTIRLDISDNGRGLPPVGRTVSGVGLATMRERAAELGGTLRLESAPGAGTTIRAELPLIVET